MNIYKVMCYTDGDYPCGDTYYNVIALASDELEAEEVVARGNHQLSLVHETKIIDLDKIKRMRKPRIIA